MSKNSGVVLTEQIVLSEGSFAILAFEWSIPDFCNWLSKQVFGEPIPSPEFQIKSVGSIPVLKFRLMLIPRQNKRFSFHFKNLCSSKIAVSSLSIRILDPKGYCALSDPKYPIGNSFSLEPESISNDFLYDFHQFWKPGEALNFTISCKFIYDIRKNSVARESGNLLQDLSSNLDNPVNPDAILVCQGQEFPCHRALLSMRSVPFKYVSWKLFFGRNKSFKFVFLSVQ